MYKFVHQVQKCSTTERSNAKEKREENIFTRCRSSRIGLVGRLSTSGPGFSSRLVALVSGIDWLGQEVQELADALKLRRGQPVLLVLLSVELDLILSGKPIFRILLSRYLDLQLTHLVTKFRLEFLRVLVRRNAQVRQLAMHVIQLFLGLGLLRLVRLLLDFRRLPGLGEDLQLVLVNFLPMLGPEFGPLSLKR